MLLLYRQTYPDTALILAGDTHTLSFKRANINPSSSSSSSASSVPQVELSFERLADFDVLSCTLLGHVHGSLGLVQLGAGKEIFLAVIAGAQDITSRYNPNERVCRIQHVDFYSLSSTTWDDFGSQQQQYSSNPDGAATPPYSYSTGSSTPTGSVDSYNMDGTSGSQPIAEHPASAMRKILSNGHFYFSSGGFDVSTRLQERIRMLNEGETDKAYDPRFVWNGFLMDSIVSYRATLPFSIQQTFDAGQFIHPIIQGYVGSHDFTLQGSPVNLMVISRLGFERAGTRFLTRGIDDDGNVANFAETETVWTMNDSRMSFVQIRGSVPLFWEQQGTTPFGGQRVQITRPPIASQPAFNKHFNKLQSAYPSNKLIQSVNLLSQKDHEALLSSSFREHVRTYNAQYGESDRKAAEAEKLIDADEDEVGSAGAATMNEDYGPIGYTEFDFHSKVKSSGGIEYVKDLIRREPTLGGLLDGFAYCLVARERAPGNNQETEETAAGWENMHDTRGPTAAATIREGVEVETLLQQQEGIYRTNCLDCLDRTNVVQDILSRLVIENYLRQTVPSWSNSEIWLSAHRSLWAENGDSLSKIYAGTGALNTSFTRSGKRTLAGALSDATKSVSRMYISNFVDKGKQSAIDGLLGNLSNQRKVVVVDPVRDSVESALLHRESEYLSQTTYAVFVGTFNVNGKVPGNESLLSWLFPDGSTEPDIIALGFQELVELSPQQIMATDPEKLRRWQVFIQDAISSRSTMVEKASEYVLLRSAQLVGTAMIVLLKTKIAGNVRNVEAAMKKTGLKGMAGNKGAVAVRLDLHDSSFCFVTAHFAAGHSNFDQRNMDYATIANGLHFRRGRRIVAHDNVLYFGDLNYRIALPNDEVRHLALIDDYPSLIEGDQLTMCMKKDLVFASYQEGPLTFRPTYKYDNLSDQYDTSEKQRIPSWTDRVLYKGQDLYLVKYSRAELKMSDHRPVYALFRAKVKVVDHSKKARIAKELLATIAPKKVALGIDLEDPSTASQDELPKPSTDSQTWWEELDIASVVQVAREAKAAGPSNIKNPFDEGLKKGAPPVTAELRDRTAPPSNGTIKRKPPPPLLGNKPTTAVMTPSDGIAETKKTSNVYPPMPVNKPVGLRSAPARSLSPSSLLDEKNDEGPRAASDRPSSRREATTEWQVITPDLAK